MTDLLKHLVDWYRAHGFTPVADLRHAGKSYRGVVLGKPVVEIAPLAGLWRAPHRSFIEPPLR